jgi:NADPH-dependent ferric siderophore reductase
MDDSALPHQFQRLRFDPRRRKVVVASVEALTPRMRRIRFASDDLSDFFSAAPDDHIRVFFPGGAGADKPVGRDLTPRAFDPSRKSLVVDFALHDAGPATDWAAQVRAGDELEIGGPRGSMIVPPDFDWTLLIGDETALPAIGRKIEEASAGALIISVVAVADAAERQSFGTKATWTPVWVQRDEAGEDDATSLRAALSRIELPRGDGFVWIAAEASAARSLRSYMIGARNHPKAWTKAAGYWKRGEIGAHERIED